MFTKTTLFHKPNEGGGSGGDQHNLGWYATPEALRTAHATATAGDWAIVGSTDTVWIWDTDTNAWKDSDQKGQVASVNGQTGTVVLTASDVGAATAAQGAKADTAVQPSAIADMETQTHASATYATKAELADKQNIIQYSTMPTASADNVGDIVQFVGTTTASYTNGYFYKCVSDGADPATYSWEEVEVQASSGGGLPSQTGMSGRFLTTDGTDASWSNAPLVNKAGASVQNQSLSLIGDGTSVAGAINIGLWSSANYPQGIAIGQDAQSTSKKSTTIGGIAIGSGSKARQLQIAIGHNTQGSQAETTGICLGNGAQTGAEAAMQICFGSRTASNTDANTLKIANNRDNYEFMSADGTIPAARHAALPSADGTYVLKLVIASGVPTLSWVAE